MQIDEAREFIKFLHGAVPWNGTWFGEYAPGEKGAHWWRKHLDEAIAALIAAPAAPQQAEPVAHLYECMGRWAAHLANSLRTADRAPPQYLIDAINAATHPPAAEVQRLRDALENVRLLAARHRKEEWAGHMLRFCADAGVTGSSLREGGE